MPRPISTGSTPPGRPHVRHVFSAKLLGARSECWMAVIISTSRTMMKWSGKFAASFSRSSRRSCVGRFCAKDCLRDERLRSSIGNLFHNAPLRWHTAVRAVRSSTGAVHQSITGSSVPAPRCKMAMGMSVRHYAWNSPDRNLAHGAGPRSCLLRAGMTLDFPLMPTALITVCASARACAVAPVEWYVGITGRPGESYKAQEQELLITFYG